MCPLDIENMTNSHKRKVENRQKVHSVAKEYTIRRPLRNGISFSRLEKELPRPGV